MNQAQMKRMLASIMLSTAMALITCAQPVLAQDTSQTTATQGQPQQQTSADRAKVEPQTQPAQLPQTGSMLPLLWALGILSLFGFILSALPLCMKFMQRR